MVRGIFVIIGIAVVAVLVAFTTPEVMAGEVPVQNSCRLVTHGGYDKWNETNYTITFQGQTKDPGSGRYNWTYVLSSNFPAGTNQLTLLTPVCSPDIGVAASSGADVLPPGEGDPTTGFGVFNFQNYTVRAATSNPSVYYFWTAVETPLRNTSMQLKSGKSLYLCQNIAAPACTGSAPFQTEATYKAGECVLRVVKQGRNIVSFTTDPPCYIPDTNSQGTYTDAKIIFTTETGGTAETVQYINDDTITETSGSPTCYTYWYGGQWRSVCYGY